MNVSKGQNHLGFHILQKSVRLLRGALEHRKGDFRELKSGTFHKRAWPWTSLEGSHCCENQSPFILDLRLIHTRLWALNKYITQVLKLIARVSLHSAQEEDILTLRQVFLPSLACLSTIISVYKLSCPSLTWPTTAASITPIIFSESEIETLIWNGSGTSCWGKNVGHKMKSALVSHVQVKWSLETTYR